MILIVITIIIIYFHHVQICFWSFWSIPRRSFRWWSRNSRPNIRPLGEDMGEGAAWPLELGRRVSGYSLIVIYVYMYECMYEYIYIYNMYIYIYACNMYVNIYIYTHLLRNILSNYWCGMHRTCKNTSVKPDRPCENGSILWRDGKNHQNDVTTSYATASRCVTTVPFSWRDGQNHQMMWPPAMQQHPGASLRFHFMANRTESPNDVTTSYATASRCITTVPFHGETDRITKWCDHQLCNSIQVHHYGSILWRDG